MNKEPKQEQWSQQQERTFPLGIYLVLLCYRLLGRRCCVVLIWLIAATYYLASSKYRRVARNYEQHLRKYVAEHQVALPVYSKFKQLYSFCCSLFYRLLAWQGQVTEQNLHAIDDAIERMHTVARQPHGALLIGAHIGSNDLLRAANTFAMQKVVNILILTSNSQKLQNILQGINKKSCLNLIMDLQARIEHHEWVVVLADRLLKEESRSVEVDFLGGKIKLPQGPWLLAHMLNVPVYTFYGVYNGQTYDVIFHEWGYCPLARKSRVADITKFAQQFAHELEQIIIKYPCEWFNFYDYWLDELDIDNKQKITNNRTNNIDKNNKNV